MATTDVQSLRFALEECLRERAGLRAEETQLRQELAQITSRPPALVAPPVPERIIYVPPPKKQPEPQPEIPSPPVTPPEPPPVSRPGVPVPPAPQLVYPGLPAGYTMDCSRVPATAYLQSPYDIEPFRHSVGHIFWMRNAMAVIAKNSKTPWLGRGGMDLTPHGIELINKQRASLYLHPLTRQEWDEFIADLARLLDPGNKMEIELSEDDIVELWNKWYLPYRCGTQGGRR